MVLMDYGNTKFQVLILSMTQCCLNSHASPGQVGGKILKEGPKWKWRCFLTTPKGVFIGGGTKSKNGAIEKALEKACVKY